MSKDPFFRFCFYLVIQEQIHIPRTNTLVEHEFFPAYMKKFIYTLTYSPYNKGSWLCVSLREGEQVNFLIFSSMPCGLSYSQNIKIYWQFFLLPSFLLEVNNFFITLFPMPYTHLPLSDANVVRETCIWKFSCIKLISCQLFSWWLFDKWFNDFDHLMVAIKKEEEGRSFCDRNYLKKERDFNYDVIVV